MGSQVLLVGETGARLEGDLALHGLAFAKAPTANDAVARMKTTRFPFVVVSPILADMGGVDFIHGVLRHFDASVVLYGNGVESSEINALLRTGRVAHFPGNVEGHAIADFLARRAGAATPPPSSPPAAFNLTPGPDPAVALAQFQGASSLMATAAGIPSTPTYATPVGAFPGFAGASTSSLPSSNVPSSNVPRPPTFGPTPAQQMGAANAQHQAFVSMQQRFEAMVEELARANSEMVALRNRIGALEQEKAALLVEVEAARRSAIADVAQVMALSDEGAAVDTEIEELKSRIGMLDGELDSVRAERERLLGEQAEASSKLAESRAAKDAAEAQLYELQGGNSRDREAADTARSELEKVRAELDAVRASSSATEQQLHDVRTKLAGEQDARASVEAQVALERNQRQSAESDLTKLRVEMDAAKIEVEEKWTKALAEESERAATAEDRVDALEKQRTELAAALAEAQAKAGAAAGNSQVEAALRTEIDKLRSDITAARTDATTVRLDLQEALLRLEEASASLTSMTTERDTLRDEAGPLREWANQLVSEHARQQGELERSRPLNDVIAKHEATIAKLEAVVEDAKAGKPMGGDVEVVLARSRQLAELVRALEPFMWGLTQATYFYKEQAPAGSEAHLRSLQQLQGVLLRLRDEIAMLDLA